MVRRSRQRGVPVITVDDDVIVGFDRPRLQTLISRGGGAAASKRAPARPRLGATIADASRIGAEQGTKAIAGAYAGKIAPDSPAARAGLRPGDVITRLNGQAISDAADVERFLKNAHAGESLAIEYVRDGRSLAGRTRL